MTSRASLLLALLAVAVACNRPPDPLVWLPLRLSRQTAGIRLLRAPEPTP